MATIRTERMIQSAPDYYQTSAIFEAIQAAQADEYDSLEAKDLDLQKQLYIRTATWGLKYWEAATGIVTNEADTYEIRRSRVLSKWRGFGNFSADLIKSVCEAFVNGEVDVTVDIPAQDVLIKFVGPLGIPPNITDVFAAVDNIIHAHLGAIYSYRYLLVSQVQEMTVDEIQTHKLGDFAPFIAPI